MQEIRVQIYGYFWVQSLCLLGASLWLGWVQSMRKLGAKYMDTFGCMSMPFGCMYIWLGWVHVCGCWVHA